MDTITAGLPVASRVFIFLREFLEARMSKMTGGKLRRNSIAPEPFPDIRNCQKTQISLRTDEKMPDFLSLSLSQTHKAPVGGSGDSCSSFSPDESPPKLQLPPVHPRAPTPRGTYVLSKFTPRGISKKKK
jgi:hypothetical protein